jgi:hypothetical protein
MDFFKIILVFLFFLSIHCNQPIKEPTTLTKPNEVKYVFAAAGFRLREAPDLKAKNLITIPYGSEVEILRKTGNTLSINYYLSGEWVEVKWKDKTGYAFDGYLLDKKEFARFDKVFQFVKNKISDKIKNKNLSSQYRIDEKWHWSQIQFSQKKFNSNFTVYTFIPVPNEEGCSFYMSSNCVNVILNDTDTIVFTDLDFEPMGMIQFIDEEIVRFEYAGAEGDNCSGGGAGSFFIYIFTSKTFIKKEWNSGYGCLDSCEFNGNKPCSRWGESLTNESFFNAKHEPIKPSAKIKEYFKRTKESEKK